MSTNRDATRDQPLPTPGQQPVQDALIAAVQERRAYGIRKYGRPLETHNGRDALTDAWEEALDLVTYLTQVRLERGDELPVATTPFADTGLRERAARALQHERFPDVPWDSQPEEIRAEYRAASAAVLAILPAPADGVHGAAENDEDDELVCVSECGFCDACGMEPFGTPAEGWREAARFLRRTARESGDRQGALHGARLIETEL